MAAEACVEVELGREMGSSVAGKGGNACGVSSMIVRTEGSSTSGGGVKTGGNKGRRNGDQVGVGVGASLAMVERREIGIEPIDR